jgi:hypothetical protein
MFLDISIPINGSISISFSNEESASPTCRGEIERVCRSALIIGAGQGGLLDLPGDRGLDGQVRVDTVDLSSAFDDLKGKGRTRWKPFKFL